MPSTARSWPRRALTIDRTGRSPTAPCCIRPSGGVGVVLGDADDGRVVGGGRRGDQGDQLAGEHRCHLGLLPDRPGRSRRRGGGRAPTRRPRNSPVHCCCRRPGVPGRAWWSGGGRHCRGLPPHMGRRSRCGRPRMGAGHDQLRGPVAVGLEPGAAVNAVATATEAKVQALAERGIPGTGTASDAIAIVWPTHAEVERFAGPRSAIGASIARAVHKVVWKGAGGPS